MAGNNSAIVRASPPRHRAEPRHPLIAGPNEQPPCHAAIRQLALKYRLGLTRRWLRKLMRAFAWPSPLVPLPSLTLPSFDGGSGGKTRVPSLEERAASGDRGALEPLVRQHARAIAELCRCLVGPDDGRDAAQEALEKIVVSITRYDPLKGTFRAWALAVARNTCRDRLRRRGLERRLFMPETDEPMELPGDQPDVERTALARIESVRLAAALETLPAPMRAAIVLFHVHESSYEEIAAALEVPMGTVMTWLHRGRKRLRVMLDGDAIAGSAL